MPIQFINAKKPWFYLAFFAFAILSEGGRAERASSETLAQSGARDSAMKPANFQFLKTQGTRVVGEDGEPVRLKGVNLGNWLLLEMWMLDIDHSVIPDQHAFESVLQERFGPKEKDRLMELFRENWITRRDFEMIQSYGMNIVRLPIHYGLLVDDSGPMELKLDAWKWIDRAIDLAREHGCYTILDLHGAPGGQSKDHTTGRANQNRYWTCAEDQERTIWIWRQIAARYAARPEIAAYDLLNEPWGAEAENLLAAISRLHAAVREVDRRHILLIPSQYREIDFYGPPRDREWENVAFTMHFYPGLFGNGRPTRETQARFLTRDLAEWDARMARLGAPLVIGEFNVVRSRAGGAEMMRRHFDAYANRAWPATMWSYKVIRQAGGAGSDSWGMAVNQYPLETVDVRGWPVERIEKFFRSLSTMPYTIDESLRRSLKADQPPEPLSDPGPEPPVRRRAQGKGALPEGWRASEIGRARQGAEEIAAPDHWILYGGGSDIYGARDQFHYVWAKANGDFDLSAKVSALEDIHDFAKAGLMVRASLAADSPQILLSVKPDGSTEWAERATTSGLTRTHGGPRVEFPNARLHIARRNGAFWLECRDEKSAAATSKTLDLFTMGPEVYIGFAVLSHDNTQLARAEFSEIKISASIRAALVPADYDTGEIQSPHQDLPPAGWEIAEIGGAKAGGFQRISNGDFDILGGGNDIWDDFDQFRFVYRTVESGFTLETTIHEMQNTHPYAKAALMIREDLSPGAACALISVFPNGTVQIAAREKRDGMMKQAGEYKCVFPDIRLRLTRQADQIGVAYRTAEGDWNSPSSPKIEPLLQGRALVGFAVLSHDDSVLARAKFREISFMEFAAGSPVPASPPGKK